MVGSNAPNHPALFSAYTQEIATGVFGTQYVVRPKRPNIQEKAVQLFLDIGKFAIYRDHLTALRIVHFWELASTKAPDPPAIGFKH